MCKPLSLSLSVSCPSQSSCPPAWSLITASRRREWQECGVTSMLTFPKLLLKCNSWELRQRSTKWKKERKEKIKERKEKKRKKCVGATHPPIIYYFSINYANWKIHPDPLNTGIPVLLRQSLHNNLTSELWSLATFALWWAGALISSCLRVSRLCVRSSQPGLLDLLDAMDKWDMGNSWEGTG